jgi:hypothetical protein
MVEVLMAARTDNSGVVEHDDVNCGAIIQEMDEAKATLRRLLSLADAPTLARRSNGTRWTNEQLLFHMVFGYMVVRALLVLVRIFGRLPPRVSRGFAAVLNFATTPFHVVNYWGSKMAALTFNHRRMAAQLDRVVGSLQRHLLRETPQSLALTMAYPTRWDPFFTPTMTLAEVYHYPTQHFDFHRQQLSGPLAPSD